MQYPYSDVLQQIGFNQIIIYSLVSFVLSIVVRVFIMLAIGEDAKAIGIKNRTLYMVLAFFFPLIVGIVYLCTRKSAAKITPRMCMVCGQTMPPGTKYCYNCSSALLEDYKLSDSEPHIKNRKIFLILGISFYIVLFIFSQTMGISIINRLVRFAQEHQRDSGSYSDYFDGYGNNGGYGDFGDFDDYEDFFNNYGNGGETDGFGEFSNGFGN